MAEEPDLPVGRNLRVASPHSFAVICRHGMIFAVNEPEDTTPRETKSDVETVRACGNVAFTLGVALALLLFIANDGELPDQALTGTLILAVIGVGLRIEAAIRERGR
ncbi:hypothetical protein SAMN05216276_105640 [Streptosporangium subroseum]|uniref:Uncharacterized protein n=1 Tax=Streptosporangium subroseum TaxID=106412 RepID=A0A239NET5_9ACTN|nr:hypothetical protein [Streptosporangium subroseum]SNT53426.1 hypothetical protein SAMN05216276_105640 [Streptosporangium subroseum]